MTAEEARFFYPSRIKPIDKVCEKYEERPQFEKAEGAALYRKTRERFEQNSKSFAFRI